MALSFRCLKGKIAEPGTQADAGELGGATRQAPWRRRLVWAFAVREDNHEAYHSRIIDSHLCCGSC